MHKVKMLLVIVLLFALIPACSKLEKSSTEADSFEFEFGFIEETDNQIALTYDGNEDLTLDLYIKNGTETRIVGILIFLDGVIQEYSLDGKQNNEMNTINMDKHSKKELNVSFVPSCGIKSKKSSLRVCAVLNPNFVLNEETDFFGDNLYVMQLLPRNIEFLVDIGEASGIEVAKSDMADTLESNTHLYLSCNDKSKIVRVNMSEPIVLNLCGSFETGGKYRLYFIHNSNLLAAFNEQKYATVEITDSGGFDHYVIIGNEDLQAENSIIALAIPVESSDDMVLRSNPICIFMD